MKMYLVILCFMILCCEESLQRGLPPEEGPPRGDQGGLSLELVLPFAGNENYRVASDSHFHVVLRNNRDDTVRLWREWCSWGYYNLSFEFVYADGSKEVGEKNKIYWTRNFPSWMKLQSNESRVIDVDWTDEKKWKGFKRLGSDELVKVKAIFEISDDRDARADDVWVGRVESEPLEVKFFRH